MLVAVLGVIARGCIATVAGNLHQRRILVNSSFETSNLVEGECNDEQGYFEQETFYGDSMDAAKHLSFKPAEVRCYDFTHLLFQKPDIRFVFSFAVNYSLYFSYYSSRFSRSSPFKPASIQVQFSGATLKGSFCKLCEISLV